MGAVCVPVCGRNRLIEVVRLACFEGQLRSGEVVFLSTSMAVALQCCYAILLPPLMLMEFACIPDQEVHHSVLAVIEWTVRNTRRCPEWPVTARDLTVRAQQGSKAGKWCALKGISTRTALVGPRQPATRAEVLVIIRVIQETSSPARLFTGSVLRRCPHHHPHPHPHSHSHSCSQTRSLSPSLSDPLNLIHYPHRLFVHRCRLPLSSHSPSLLPTQTTLPLEDDRDSRDEDRSTHVGPTFPSLILPSTTRLCIPVDKSSYTEKILSIRIQDYPSTHRPVQETAIRSSSADICEASIAWRHPPNVRGLVDQARGPLRSSTHTKTIELPTAARSS